MYISVKYEYFKVYEFLKYFFLKTVSKNIYKKHFTMT